ncbi:snRNA-activating protein complex subunit [Striga hermonthica]|uniref:snRNA-activating protein complex subunit n=1 Tax=Striga hermonthica TaxID=68872 RepID=A0A9N7NJK4_STRHE|nr:snRNA-activating protein complex subunit [Striga hermonthica]
MTKGVAAQTPAARLPPDHPQPQSLPHRSPTRHAGDDHTARFATAIHRSPASATLSNSAFLLPISKPTLMLGHEEGGEDVYVSIPLGGPIYVPDSIGPLTRVSDFETSVFQELQSLKDELSRDSTEACDEDISVDELKIITEDELVNKAFEEAFKATALEFIYKAYCLMHPDFTIYEVFCKTDGNCASGLELGSLHNSEGDTKALVSSASSNAVPRKTRGSKKSNQNPSGKQTKRKRKKQKNNDFDESYLAEVEELARIKQKQEEDKATVRLHSFEEPGNGANAKAEKIRSLKSGSVSTKVRASSTIDNVPVQYPETLLSIEVYHSRKTWWKTQEFLVLGRQFLSEVRDKIYCSTDEIMKKAGQFDPSGYFFIEDVFCNDMRESSAIDYSKPIIDWLKNSKDDALEKWESIVSGELQQKQKALFGSESKQQLQLPKLRSVLMQCTRFCDLRFRLGAGYLYCHQGDCKHVIVIRDMRLIHPEDVQNRAAYPLITLQLKARYKKCSVCKIYRADKMTVDDKWAAANPCYFCDVCYYMLHYSNGSLLYSDFKVYECHHDS